MSLVRDVPVDMQRSTCVVGEGLRKLYERSELCDITLVASGDRFPAHKAMLAAMSTHFRSYLARGPGSDGIGNPMEGLLVQVVAPQAVAALDAADAPKAAAPAEEAARAQVATTEEASRQKAAAPAAEMAPDQGTQPAEPAREEEAGGALAAAAAQAAPANPAASAEAPKAAPPAAPQCLELDVKGVKTSEAVHILLDYMYSIGASVAWEYAPSSLEVNRDVLHLAQKFHLEHLHEHAARWLAKGLTTANVVSRLVICDELRLGNLREKIIEQLTAHPAGLTIVSTSPEIMHHPKILQDLLIRVASVHSTAKAEKEKDKEQDKENRAAPAVPAVKKEPAEAAQEKPQEKPAKQGPATKKQRKG